MMQKRIAAIHDISCFGKCSLTVVLPILSAVGIETSVIPTAVLSTHTGGFENYTLRDLTQDMLPIVNHWKTLGIGFDAIYSGYLASIEQINIVSQMFTKFKTPDTLIFVDPVMADNGKLYFGFADDFPQQMRGLCSQADIIVPNITEACLMLNRPYQEGPYTKEYIENLLEDLADLGPKQVVLTGVYFDDNKRGAAAYDQKTKNFYYSSETKVPGYYHGTGDVFGSVLLAALLSEQTLEQAIITATQFTQNAIKRSYDEHTDIRFGVNFEYGLKDLSQQLPLTSSSRKSI